MTASSPTGTNVEVPIWGPTASGKTTYLVALSLELAHSDWEMWPADNRAFHFLDQKADLMERGLFSAANPSGAPSSPYFFHIRRKGGLMRQSRQGSLSFWDASGEVYEDPIGLEETFGGDKAYQAFFDGIRTASGVICLLDLDCNPEKPEVTDRARIKLARFIRRTLFALRKDSHGNVLPKIQRPIAWVLTKMDLPGRYEWKDDPQGFAAEVLGEKLIDEIDSTCLKHMWEASSAVGVLRVPETGKEVPNYESGPNSDLYKARIKDPAHREPFGIVEPLIWVLDGLL